LISKIFKSSKKLYLLKNFYRFLLILANIRILMTTGYCVKCRDKREMQGTSAITMKNGKPAVKGTCPTCNTSMFRIGKA
tara:strand:- start:1463 stop:1699 length:237 start_codon:yes stop_codon:yes gene_type:complete